MAAQVAAAEAASFSLTSTAPVNVADGDVQTSHDTKPLVNNEKHILAYATQEVKENGPATANALEVYSVFTVGQKKAIILSGSFIGLLSYMSGTIYYPAIDQVDYGSMCSFLTFMLTPKSDQSRSGSLSREDKPYGHRIFGKNCRVDTPFYSAC